MNTLFLYGYIHTHDMYHPNTLFANDTLKTDIPVRQHLTLHDSISKLNLSCLVALIEFI